MHKYCDRGDLEINFNDVWPFTKYNNNFGFVSDFSDMKEKAAEHRKFNKVAQAFSHYSFQKSDGNILICDLQGVVQRLTDPMIFLNKNPGNLEGDLYDQES